MRNCLLSIFYILQRNLLQHILSFIAYPSLKINFLLSIFLHSKFTFSTLFFALIVYASRKLLNFYPIEKLISTFSVQSQIFTLKICEKLCDRTKKTIHIIYLVINFQSDKNLIIFQMQANLFVHKLFSENNLFDCEKLFISFAQNLNFYSINEK